MEKLKFGERVLIDHKLERKETYDQVEQDGWLKQWKKVPFSGKFQEGIYLGERTLSNGKRYRDATYKPIEHFRVQLVCISPNLNPVYVIFDDVEADQKKEQTGKN